MGRDLVSIRLTRDSQLDILPKAKRLVLYWSLLILTPIAYSGEVRIAVASNFAEVTFPLGQAFMQKTGHHPIVSYASTGKLYAQIINGAPFEVFLAADRERPRQLEVHGVAVPGTRFTYAVGQLVLWSKTVPLESGAELAGLEFDHLAIANEKFAPYGRAAMEYLGHLGLWEDVQPRLVRGENIGQAFQFVHSGTAEVGLVARTHVMDREGFSYVVPSGLYAAIDQQVVMLKESDIARAFLVFLQSRNAQEIIRSHGYQIP